MEEMQIEAEKHPEKDTRDIDDTNDEKRGGTKRKVGEADFNETTLFKKPRINVADDVIIDLDIGGKRAATFQSTLCKERGSKLYEIFSQDPIPLEKNERGFYIIDRPRKPFRVILNYLRTGKFYMPTTEEEKVLVIQEIEHWRMRTAYDKYTNAGAYFEGSTLLDPAQQSTLNEWYGKNQKWKLLYKASRDGWQSSDFHAKVDNRGPTMTVIQANNYIFGGYTPIEWKSRNEYAYDVNTWIFSLANPTNNPLKMINENPKGKDYKYSIYDHKDYGPVFGGGYDIGIQSCPNKSNQNYSNLGYNFVLPGKTLGTEEAKNFLTGSFYFTVSEIEVYTITT